MAHTALTVPHLEKRLEEAEWELEDCLTTLKSSVGSPSSVGVVYVELFHSWPLYTQQISTEPQYVVI